MFTKRLDFNEVTFRAGQQKLSITFVLIISWCFFYCTDIYLILRWEEKTNKIMRLIYWLHIK